MSMNSRVVAVSLNRSHAFSKVTASQIKLIVGQGIEGDARCGVTVKHRSRVALDPTQANLRQVHLLHTELFEELAARGCAVSPGALGENIATIGIALLELPVGAELQFGGSSVVKLTGLRNPCAQIDQFQPGLMAAVFGRTTEGVVVRKAGVMGVVIRGGIVRLGDQISVTLPAKPHTRLERV